MSSASFADVARELCGPQSGVVLLRFEPTIVALFFEPGSARPRRVLKAARTADAVASLEREFDLLSRLGGTSLADSVPEAIATSRHGLLGVFLYSALDGVRMKDAPPGRHFGRTKIEYTLQAVTGWLIELSRAVEVQASSAELFEEPVATYLRRFETTDAERTAVETALAAVVDHGCAAVFGHGDFTPANVLMDRDRIAVLDFELAGPHAPLDDILHFLAATRSTTSARDRREARAGFFREAFYGNGFPARAGSRAVQRIAGAHEVPAELVEPLFLLSWVRLAVTASEQHAKSLGVESVLDEPQRLWPALDADPDDFLPVARVRSGVCDNVRDHVERRSEFALDVALR